MILRARHVVTMDGAPIENGAVLVRGDKIAEVGPWSNVKKSNGGNTIDLGESALLPGLINAHCHLDYTCLRGAIPRQESFTAWIQAINVLKATLTENDYLRSIEEGFAEAAAFGTTTAANLEAFPELLAGMDAPPLRTWWFAELIDVRAKQPLVEICAQLQRAFRRRDGWLGGLGLAPHAPFTASAQLYEEASNLAQTNDLLLTTHLAESVDEMQMFSGARGALFQFMESIGRGMDDAGDVTPVGLMLRHRILDERCIVAHLNELTTDDFKLLAEAPRFHVVHCPRSHAYFAHARFGMRKLRDLGFNICVGTDSLASNDDLSLLAELRQLGTQEPNLSAQELFEMVTVNAAAALQQADQLGRIRRGFAADLVALPCDASASDIFEELLEFRGSIPWVMVSGQVLRQAA
ncbi:MAG: amidohydrolase family protein [Chthoniobacterales bacterium]|jgi:cytosine/adenosine deaminase-related metal-dependent hydrolase|nr:amidohydrolase family protein [Chthoniobacterales bacterium]